MKWIRLFLIGIIIIYSSIVSYSRARYNGIAERGGKTVQTSVSVSYELMETFPSCTITVYLAGTTTIASIYSDNSGTVKANPFTADSTDAKYFFYADNGNYDIKFSGTGITSPFTKSGVTVIDSASVGSSVSLRTNNISNASQSILNLKNGNNTTIIDGGSGNITIESIPITDITYAFSGDGSTVVNKLLKLSGNLASKTVAGNTSGAVGIGISGSSGAVVIRTAGRTTCTFDAALSISTNKNNYVQISSTTDGLCHASGGTTYPTSGQVLGRILSFTDGASVADINFFAEVLSASTVIPLSPIDISLTATSGAGTPASPWIGWSTSLCIEGTHCHFPKGVYRSSSTIAISVKQKSQFSGEAGTILNCTGSGDCVTLIGTPTPEGASGPSFVLFENFTIQGNANATRGLYVETVHRSIFRNIRVIDVNSVAFEFHFTIANIYDRLVHSYFGSVIPVNGIKTNIRGAGETVQACTFISPIIEGVSGDGIVLNYSQVNHFLGGTSEGNGGNGVVINSTSLNTFISSMDIEANSGGNDLIDNGKGTKLLNILSAGLVTIGASSRSNTISGGVYNSVTYTAGMHGAKVTDDPYFNVSGTGVITSVPGVDGDTTFINYVTGSPASQFLVFPTLQNSWVDSPYVFYRKANGEVYLEGQVASGTISAAAGGTIMFVMDSQYWPIRDHRFEVSCGVSTAAATCHVLINTAGEVRILAGNDASAQVGLFLDGISFKAYTIH